jgi:hypothetical protein
LSSLQCCDEVRGFLSRLWLFQSSLFCINEKYYLIYSLRNFFRFFEFFYSEEKHDSRDSRVTSRVRVESAIKIWKNSQTIY